MRPAGPDVKTTGDFVTVSGRFYRAVTVGFEHRAVTGSSRAGRYSRPDQPTLYMSASPAGVEAAMIAHAAADGSRSVLAFDVDATDIVDMRLAAVIADVRRHAGDPFADWQVVAAGGGEPPSWRARDWLEGVGAKGLIDPSRKAPGLWHLVLFSWNVSGGPSVTEVPPAGQ